MRLRRVLAEGDGLKLSFGDENRSSILWWTRHQRRTCDDSFLKVYLRNCIFFVFDVFCIIGLVAIWRSYCREVYGLWVYFSLYFRIEVVRLLDSPILIIYVRMHHSDAEAGGLSSFSKKNIYDHIFTLTNARAHTLSL